jgi:hypothetical protein
MFTAELSLAWGVPISETRRRHMQAAIDRVMQSYGMMVNITPVQEAEARQRSPIS